MMRPWSSGSMKIFQIKGRKIPGTKFRIVHKKAFRYYQEIKRKSKRRPYVRSTYFNKEKIFISLFWHHVFENRLYTDQLRRLKFFPCGIELMKSTTFAPESKDNPNKPSEILHRFAGFTGDNEFFIVQIKENKNTSEKFLISIYPADANHYRQ